MPRRVASLSLLGCLVACAPLSIGPDAPLTIVGSRPLPRPEQAAGPAPIEVQTFEINRGIGGEIRGVVRNSNNRARLADAIVLLSCTCLPELAQTVTNERGVYSFVALPPGDYTVLVYGPGIDGSKKKLVELAPELPADEGLVVDFSLAAKKGGPVPEWLEEMRGIPIGHHTRDFKGVIE